MDLSGRSTATEAAVDIAPKATTIVALTSAAGNLRTFAAAAEVAGLTRMLTGKGWFTVFAPSDEAFVNLPAGTFEALLKDPARLKAVLNYHIVAGHLLTEDLKSGQMATLQGLTLTAMVSATDVRVNGVRVTRANMVASNGVVHVIESVILPKNWQLVAAA